MHTTVHDLSHAEPVVVRDFNVVQASTQGASRTRVTIIVDFALLRTLAARAVENNNGEAVLYYGAIKAKVQE